MLKQYDINRIFKLMIRVIIIVMIKGFTTIRFVIGLSLAFIIFYSLLELYRLWSEEEVTVRKIITFLILVISMALMYITESAYHIKRFMLGAGRYNQLRHINESGIPVSRNLSAEQTNINEQRERPKKVNRFEQNINKIKKYYSLKPADFLKQSTSINEAPKAMKTPLTPERRPHRAVSFQISSPFNEDMNSASIQRRNKNQQLNKFMKSYKQFIAKSKSNEDWEQLNINKAKNIIGNIFKNQANKQIDNLQLLEEKLQNLFDIHIVDSKSVKDFQGIDRRSERQNRFRNTIKLTTDKQVTLDQIFQSYQRGLLKQCGYKLKSKPAGDIQYRTRMINQVDNLLIERKKMDRLINYKQPFIHHSDRVSAIQKLKIIAKHYLQGKQLLDAEYRISDELDIKQLIVWVLSRHLNDVVRINLNEAFVFIDNMSLDIDRKYTIKWLLAQTDALVHYDVVVEKADAENKVSASNYVCKPGENNIQSLFVTYLNIVNQSFRNRIKSIPVLQSYMNQIM